VEQTDRSVGVALYRANVPTVYGVLIRSMV